MTKAIGIDFGTTNSAVAIAGENRTVTLARFGDTATFRSILYFAELEDARTSKLSIAAGPSAIDGYLNAKTPGRLIQSTKSYLASRLYTQTQILGQSYTLEELIGILLRHLRKAVEEQFGSLGTALVAGRPVHFSGARSDADDAFALGRLRAAFARAGFDDVRFVAEPVAAAYQYQQRLAHNELVLIADFGGGTSDFSLVHLQPKRSAAQDFFHQVIGSDGVGVAGDSFDSKLVRHLVAPLLGLGTTYRSPFGKILPVPNWLYEHLERWHHLSFLKTRKNLELLKKIQHQALEPEKVDGLIKLVDQDLGYRLYRAIEAAKCLLTEQPRGQFRFAEAGMTIVNAVERNEFEDWIAPDLRRITQCLDRLLARANVGPDDVDAIFMTGGSSFVPAIRRLFERKFPRAAMRAGQEFTSVAEGLALHALEQFE